MEIKIIFFSGEVKHKTGNGGAFTNLVEEDRLIRQKDKLSKDFSLLLRSTEFADVALTTGTKSFMAHKAVLGGNNN